ncbi:5'-nucleotidase domain-containing protein 1 [Scaptodrosophila lebanonensis]|uniref:5'-nucleotidase domain-containing protein 1 n=1 Tax=Drosophila lebanonensis TaxID=7225 RepID=A0A6J2UDN2_DROLE|nr:5'-nucleotidase domain-containing protein 1 [Scaptodrosophila lebanonensis]
MQSLLGFPVLNSSLSLTLLSSVKVLRRTADVLLLCNNLSGNGTKLKLATVAHVDSSYQLARRHKNTTLHRQFSRYSASTIMGSSDKHLVLNDYSIVGFDLDGTLLRYNLQEMTVLVYNVLKQYLVDEKGYSRALLDQPLDMDFLQKGLVLDGPRGNVLKLSNEAVILRATHGTRLLSDAEIEDAYGCNRKWDVTTAFYEDPLSTWNGPAADQMRALLDYFDMPSALVFAQAVDLVDQETGRQQNGYTVWPDLLAGLMHNYSRDNFSNGKSAYFTAMRAEPERFVLPTSGKVISWLEELRAAGKKLFLLTGSNIDFANLTATQAFGKDWPQMFDFIGTYAKKPGFFTMQRPFMRVDATALQELPNSEVSLGTTLQKGNIYSQGNWHQLHETIAKMLNKDTASARAIYFGDNIIQDVYTPVKHRDFDAVAIAEEMLLAHNNYPYPEALGSRFWGSYFCMKDTPTLWAGLITKYAQLCVPSMEIMAQCSTSKLIVSKDGFYPTQPKELENAMQSNGV